MEEDIPSPQTPTFGIPNKNINFTEFCNIKLDYESNLVEKKTKNKKKKKEKNKNKQKKYNSEKLNPSHLTSEEENPYYELLIKKIKLRNDFDRKNSKKFLEEVEEAFEWCDLVDELSEDES